MPDIPVAETSAARYATVHANFATHQALAGLPALVTSGVVLFTPSCVAHDETTIFTPCAVRGFLVNGELRSHPRGGEKGIQLLAPARYAVKVSAIGESGRQVILDLLTLDVKPGQVVNLAEMTGAPGMKVPDAPGPAAPVVEKEWVAEDLGTGLARIVEKEKRNG